MKYILFITLFFSFVSCVKNKEDSETEKTLTAKESPAKDKILVTETILPKEDNLTPEVPGLTLRNNSTRNLLVNGVPLDAGGCLKLEKGTSNLSVQFTNINGNIQEQDFEVDSDHYFFYIEQKIFSFFRSDPRRLVLEKSFPCE